MSRIADFDFDVGPFKERLEGYAKENYKSFRGFEDKCGMTHAGIAGIGKQGPTLSYLARIADAIPDLNMNWLLTGDGPVHKNEERKQEGGEENSVGLPILPFSAMAGPLSENLPSSFLEGMERCYVPDFSARGADYAIRVDGDSMYPRYHNGEILAIKVIKDPTFFQWGKVYCLATNQGCVIKRLFPDPDDPDGIICHSENYQHYPDYKITKADIFNVAIVVGHIGIE